MSLTLLLDLDDTLLSNPFEKFMPAYLDLLSKKLSPFVAADKMIPILLGATEKMIENRSPSLTLEQVFDQIFYPSIGIQKNELEPLLVDFYEDDFFRLKEVTQERPEALQLVEHAINKKYTVCIATNPLFPMSAMQARLKWAGFETPESTFNLITSYENMHFSKPNSAYYAEILGKCGWPQNQVCMVGNSLKDDILPSACLGIPSFWVNGNTEQLPESAKPFCTIGSLDQVSQWLTSLENYSFSPTLKSTEALLSILRSTPAVLNSLTKSLSVAAWQQKSTPTAVSILELTSHILDVEKEVSFTRIHQVLVGDCPFIAGVDSDSWVEQRNYQETRSPQVMNDFLDERISTIQVLEKLSNDQWLLPAKHSIFGPTTLSELVEFSALHDIDHIRQIFSQCPQQKMRKNHVF